MVVIFARLGMAALSVVSMRPASARERRLLNDKKRFVSGRGYTKQDWDAVQNPELTAEQIAEMRPFSEVFPELAASIRRGKGLHKLPAKRQATLRLSPEVIDTYNAGGPGWQARIDDDLRRLNKIK